MNRTAGRWVALGILGSIVVGLGIATSLSNRKLVDGLVGGDAAAFSVFAERQDAYIFLQSESVAVREQVARQLGNWISDKAARMVIALIPDPNPSVRAALVESLARIAASKPASVAAEFGAGGAAETAALIEAAASDPTVGVRILEQALSETPDAPNGYLLAKRLGSVAQPALIRALASEDDQVALSAADALAALDLAEKVSRDVAASVLAKYRDSTSRQFRDRILPILAAFNPREARQIFAETALDHTAPSELRAVAADALRRLGDPLAERLSADADTSVARAASGK